VSGKLILCATPIGNLGDVSSRLKSELEKATVVYVEDTRRAAILLRALDVHAKPRSYFVGNEVQRAAELAEQLEAGSTVALITDAGMPGISDPGLSAVRAAREVGAEVTVVPGPSAVTAAIAVSGLPADRFAFEGFLPRKGKERRRRLSELAAEPRTTVLFSAKSRLVADLRDLAATLGENRRIVVARELTKVYEEIWPGTLGEAATHWEHRELRGEFTLVIGGADPVAVAIDEAAAEARTLIAAGVTMKDAVRRIAGARGISRRELYEEVLRNRG
jgi:16S rRNA (cytidine1402-2'-O)-methyltransferase